MSDYDLDSGYLPIAITTEAGKEFSGWYKDDVLMTAADLANVSGSEVWEAKFIDIEPTSVHVNFSVGSTNGIDSVPLEDVALTVGGVAITAKESANGFILGGTTYLDPTLSLQAATACKAPIGVTGSVSGYNVLGTFLTTDKLDVDNTEQLETGEFFVGLSTVSTGVMLHANATNAKIFFGDMQNKEISWTDHEYLPMCILYDNGSAPGFKGWFTQPTGGELVTYQNAFEHTDLYAQYVEADAPCLLYLGLQRSGGYDVSGDKQITFMNVSFIPDELYPYYSSLRYTQDALNSCGPIPFGAPTIDDPTITVYPEVALLTDTWVGYGGEKPTTTYNTLQAMKCGIVYTRTAT